MHKGQKRIPYLDGLRGVAILAVAVWHYTNSDYVKFFPFGGLYASIPVLDHGWVGVNIFFLISGFVILLTLERCSSFLEFMLRRWIRLFPAMLIATIAIFAVSRVLGDFMPHGRPPAVNMLPGLTFLIPTLWQEVLGRPVDEMDGVFWTLYVEMGFYLVFGSLYFLLGWRRGLAVLAGIWLTVVCSSRIASAMDLQALSGWIAIPQWFGAEYYGWFVSGALFLKGDEHGSNRLFVAAVIAGVVSAFTSGLWQPDDWLSCIYLVGCVALFAAAQRSVLLQRWLSNRLLLFAGAISYPLYLLHNEIGIGLIAASPHVLPSPLWPALPPLMLLLMAGAAWAVARGPERWITRHLRRRLMALSKPETTGTRS